MRKGGASGGNEHEAPVLVGEHGQASDALNEGAEMPKRDKTNTNPASTYYVLSALHRLGYDARIMLGKRKTVDILVRGDDGRLREVEVKGLAGKNPWPVDSVGESREDLFFAMVCFGGTIEQIETSPEVWIIPSTALEGFVYTAPGGRRVVQYETLRREGRQYKDAWELLAGDR